MTGKKVFIPTLTDVLAFPDGVPVLTDKAEERAGVLSAPAQTDVHTAPTVVQEATQTPTPDVDALAQQMWAVLEPEIKIVLRETMLTFFEQQQPVIIENLGSKIRPLLVQALESDLNCGDSDLAASTVSKKSS